MPGIRLVELHPIIVHFPIALLLTSVLIDFVAVILRRWNVADVGTWLLGLGVVGALLAGLTGTVSSHNASAPHSSIGNLLELHQRFAFATGALFATLFVARIVWLAPHILAGMRTQFRFVVPLENRLRGAVPALFAKPPSAALIALYLVLSVAAAVLLGVTGYLGGALVYDHGLGTPTALVLGR
jgi:uncharacterized membrane protein